MPLFKMVQGELRFEPKTWGGRREGAGRPKLKRRTTEPHRARPVLRSTVPVHVVMRVGKDVGRLRRRAAYHAIRKALGVVLGRDGFRVVHVSIQHNHLHLLVEADGKVDLSDGMRELTRAAARRLNDAMGRARGTVFPQRYHATQLRTPRQVRNGLAYVLNNWRRHREDLAAARDAKLDPYSSAVSFDGWDLVVPFVVPTNYQPLPVATATTWLLTVGWRRHGLVGVRETPASALR